MKTMGDRVAATADRAPPPGSRRKEGVGTDAYSRIREEKEG
jgi:hypothetical protein